MAKIKPSTELANGTRASGLNIKEYQVIARLAELPALPESAGNISCQYAYDGFLPDYSVSLEYDVPAQTRVVIDDSSKGKYIRSQSVSVVDHVQRVRDIESRQ